MGGVVLYPSCIDFWRNFSLNFKEIVLAEHLWFSLNQLLPKIISISDLATGIESRAPEIPCRFIFTKYRGFIMIRGLVTLLSLRR